MATEFEDILNEYAETVIERAQSNLRIKRRVRGKVVNRVASGNLLRSLTYKLRIRYGCCCEYQCSTSTTTEYN